MALSADMIWEIRANGTATGGGGFVAGASGTDYSQQNAVHSTRTDIVIDGSDNTMITSAADNFASDDVGNIINITSGTGFTPGRYEITAVASGVATLDRGCGTTGSTGGNGVLGGAMTLTDANLEDTVAGNDVYIQNDGTHTLTGAIDLATAGDITDGPISVYGYNSTRGDGENSESNRPTIACGANDFNAAGYWRFFDLIYTGTAVDVLFIDSRSAAIRCKITNSSGTSSRHAIDLNTGAGAFFCEAISDNGHGIDVGNGTGVIGCYVHDCGSRGYNVTSTTGVIAYSIADSCPTGIYLPGPDYIKVINCTIYNSTTEGVRVFSTSDSCLFLNIIIDSCAIGINSTNSVHKNLFFNINFSNNTANKSNAEPIYNETTLDPQFVDAANGDFRVGGNMKGIGAPGLFPGGLSNGYPDLGAVQRIEGGGSSGLHPIMTGI